MHETNLKDVKLNIDSITKQDNGDWKATGWIGFTTPSTLITNIFIGENIIDVNWEQRPDVSDFYKGNIQGCIGFNITIPHEDINKKLWISLNGLDAIEFISLGKWATQSSGFNRTDKDVIVVDNFYADPDLVREYEMTNLELPYVCKYSVASTSGTMNYLFVLLASSDKLSVQPNAEAYM